MKQYTYKMTTRKKGVDEAYRYNFAILEQIIGKQFEGRIVIGARK